MTVPKILLYYVMAPVEDPKAVMLWQRELCERLGLRGRIIISPHGINGTVGGEIAACKQYIKKTREYPAFRGLSETIKWSDGTGFEEDQPEWNGGFDRSAPWKKIVDFPKLSVKVRDELVAFGAPEEVKVGPEGVIGGGTHLSPQQVNDLVEQRGDEVVFFDGRNAWEAEIGRFSGAIVPDVQTTHGFIEQIESGAFDDIKDRPVVTYCTGGIRCEILSALMKNRGFSEIYQIDGGIVRYGEAFGDKGLWEGSLAVFDARETINFSDQTKVIGSCDVCGEPAALLANCVDQSCKTRMVVCDLHDQGDHPCAEHAAATA
ncbi:tRNA uridine(34) hydroxylase [Actinomyces minihominis]|uniref:tRNA uridine(34) hydroxylase n=1 Tax=Actinomyces minihominis TaxID=2002838 RepID=UPI000C06CAA6|nr:rhodanese-related sulfurtransferase [Actinomyces minihominis]